ncbi:MAG TPA: 8-oxo-dGTP diphosphatase [Methylomusa anaerophila]|uniref:Oxidized purine nucleoside triphosphate hydrolase n=1 Tax=Methylomusa anaerophila TaxID=1930071 RepID=A0A348AHH5_9FIRM|nr:8-oxo-dGTP diphosphatase [Methylomusa anaerophila]BBB90523.1 8-oxo-dGTP diphosphatase [Methylomusa anaerophila]HML89837.1 8-oxo-dGTP diphosphatase [Methylomusa anaerophila]
MYSSTLCLPVQTEGNSIKQILLGMKKRGFGRGKYNGFGGKLEAGESVRAAAVRELREECGLTALEEDLEYAGKLLFVFPANRDFDHDVDIFLVRRWRGEPRETEEMLTGWYSVKDIPYKEMWAGDIYWLPKILAGEKIRGRVVFADDNEGLQAVEITGE